MKATQMKNPACNMQLTQPALPDEPISVTGGNCKAPYRCSQCTNRRQERIPDPEKKGQPYKTNACERDNRLIDITAQEWMDAEAKRINNIRGRSAEVQYVELNGKDSEQIALFVNRVASAGGRPE